MLDGSGQRRDRLCHTAGRCAGQFRECDAEVRRSTELRLLDIIRDYAERGEQITNLDQLARDLGISAKSRVSAVLANLERMQLIQSDKTTTGKIRPRTIRINKVERTRLVPVMGRIAAGQPLLSNADDVKEFVPIPARYVRQMDVYMLEVHGDSMTGDGILDGDHVLVAANQEPRENEIAVVFIEGEEAATIKHVRYEQDSIILISSNPAVPTQTYNKSDRPRIQGKVIGVLRWPS